MTRRTWLFPASLAALLLAFAFKSFLFVPPSVVMSPEAGQFDTGRAFGRLQRILGDQAPHPIDTAASDGVRDRLVAALRDAGLDPRVTDDLACTNTPGSRSINCSRVRNVVVTIGPATGKHLLLVSHYDSTPTGPGAADDGIGVAGMIEIASILRTETLQRPVTFLFDEGEESGLSGARSFLDHDPVAAEVDTLINMEARGTEGPAIMFETSRPNAAAIRAFAAGSAHPVANSLSTDFYRLIPNSTDVTVFAQARPDWTILNFAVIGNETRYHSQGDSLDALDLRSLQHMGGEALGIARRIAGGDAPGDDGTIIYADVYGLVLISVPLLLGLVLLGALGLFYLAAVVRHRAYGRALLTAVLALVAAEILAWVLDWAASALRPADYWRGHPLVTFTAFYAAALLGGTAILLVFGRGVARERLRAAFWLLFVLLGGGICFIAPGAAIYFLFPPLLAAPGFVWPRAARPLAVAAGLLQFVLFSEVLTEVELLLIDGPYWILGALGTLAAFPLLIEAVPAEAPVRRAVPLGGLAAATLALWAAALLVPRATDDRQQLFTIEYFKDLAATRAVWTVSDKAVPLPDHWGGLSGWTLEPLPYSGRRRWTAQAPDLPVPVPSVDVAQLPGADGTRHLRLTLHLNGADVATIAVPPEGQVIRAGRPGQLVALGGDAADAAWLRCYGRSCDGLELEVELRAAGPVPVDVLGSTFRLPGAAAPLVAARPALSRPQYTPDASYVVSRAIW